MTMRTIFLVSFAILLSFSLNAQQKQPDQAWEVITRLRMRAKKDAPAESKRQVTEYNKTNTVYTREFISKDLYNLFNKDWKKYGIIINRKDGLVYTYQENEGKAYKMTLEDYSQNTKDHLHSKVIHLKTYPDETKDILGFRVQKATYDLVVEYGDAQRDTMSTVCWFTTALPNWFDQGGLSKLPGLPLEVISENKGRGDGIVYTNKAVQIKTVALDSLKRKPPRKYKMVSYGKE